MKCVTMVKKILTCYLPITVSDKPIVTIIHRQEVGAFHFSHDL